MIAQSKTKSKKTSTRPSEMVEMEEHGSYDVEGGKTKREGTRGATKRKRRATHGKSGSSKASMRSVARLVMSLSCHGYDEQLVWLEAYLRDEARDRTVDGEWHMYDRSVNRFNVDDYITHN